MEISDETVLNHVRRQGIKAADIYLISINDQEFDRDDLGL
tara:strand:+ start:597 stop:716 length:120 start_codon:yes stop_codon:yes gene_type:complete